MKMRVNRDGITLWQGDAARVSECIEPESVDLIVTSPPYFALRSYEDGGEHYAGQIGSEPTPREFIDALIACTADWMKVLKPTGSIFVNLGDKYANDAKWGGATGGKHAAGLHGATGVGRARMSTGIPAKSLMGLPWRYALRCVDDLGLILRAEVIWCLSGGVRIYARVSGRPRPIMLRDLVRAYRPQDVQLWNGEKWTQVLGWNRSADTDGALELELRSGERIGCTRGHQWPTSRGLLRSSEIRVGDVIDITNLPDEDKRPDMLPDHDVGWFVGLYLAEGSRSDTTIQIAGHLDEVERVARLRALSDAYDGSCNTYQTSEFGATCNIHSPVLSGILDRYVSPGSSRTKRLTMHAWQRSSAFLAAVVTGYLEGDGHYDAKNDRWRIGFCSNDELAADLRTAAARLGAKLSLRRSATGWRGEWRWSKSDHWNSKSMGEVVAIRASRARQFFDVGVADEPHLFALASGVLTHNSKPNGMPESVTDRVRRSHEQWFHLTREGRYFAGIDEIREPHARQDAPRPLGTRNATQRHVDATDNTGWKDHAVEHHPLGKLPGSVWTIPSEPLKVPEDLGVDHFAAFPTEWPRRIITGWSPTGICLECGEGRRPVVGGHQLDATRPQARREFLLQRPTSITGYGCACGDNPTAPTRPAVVLDPFGGTGTVALVARLLGRHAHYVDLSGDYLRLAEWRIWHDEGAIRRCLARSGIAAPVPPVIDGQLAMFGGAA